MSLYYVQKLMYNLNRDQDLQGRYKVNPDTVLTGYQLTSQETEAIQSVDIGLLYVLGVNGQILMHFAAMYNIAWPVYLQAMRDGIEKYGPVKKGLYVMNDSRNDK